MWVECLALLRKIEANRKPIVSVSEVKKTTNKELVNYGIWLHLSIMTVNNLSVVDYILLVVGSFVFFMKLRTLSWNVRGLNNPKKKRGC
jgi:hypothetical protein